MRNLSTASLLVSTVILSLAGCAYDAELLGEPEPEPIKGLEHIALPEDVPYQEIEDQPEGTPIEFAQNERDAIYSPADSLDMFADLRFFGSWYWHDEFGWVWRPTMSRTWRPMTQGYWAWTEHDWMWVTSDRFGSDPYNYGYWAEDVALGWVWVPDCSWQPLRCQWMQWDSYVAWAPLLPPDEGEYREPWELEGKDTPWVTVRVANFMKFDVVRYRVQPKFNRGESEKTVSRAPLDIVRLEKVLGHRVERIHIPPRQPIVVIPAPIVVDPILPIIVEPPCGAGWIIPAPVFPVPVYPDQVGGGGGGVAQESKMKGGGNSNPPPPKSNSPPKFKDVAKDPPKSGGKSKAK